MPRRRSESMQKPPFPLVQALLGFSFILVLLSGLAWWHLGQAAAGDVEAWKTWDFLAVGANYSMPAWWGRFLRLGGGWFCWNAALGAKRMRWWWGLMTLVLFFSAVRSVEVDEVWINFGQTFFDLTEAEFYVLRDLVVGALRVALPLLAGIGIVLRRWPQRLLLPIAMAMFLYFAGSLGLTALLGEPGANLRAYSADTIVLLHVKELLDFTAVTLLLWVARSTVKWVWLNRNRQAVVPADDE